MTGCESEQRVMWKFEVVALSTGLVAEKVEFEVARRCFVFAFLQREPALS